MTTPAYPSQSNTYVPEVSGKLVVDYSRNVKDFPVNRYVQQVPVDVQKGFYTQMTREQAGRVMESNGSDVDWADGNDRPTHANETESFAFLPYKTRRKDWGFVAGNLAVEQAKWDVVAQNAGNTSERVMRYRTVRAVTTATTTGNYSALPTHVVTVSNISGVTGKWDLSTTARKDIERSLHAAAKMIVEDSLNGVKPKDLIVVMSMGCALKIKMSQEIIDYIKGSQDAIEEIRGTLKGQNANSYWGLPSHLYGYELVIEDTVKITSKKGASTLVNSPVLADATPFMCSRVGALRSERSSESASFSSLTQFFKEEFTVEQFSEPKHRRVEHHIVEDFDTVLSSPISTVLFQAAVN